MKKHFIEDAHTKKHLIGVRTISQEWGEVIIGIITKIDESFITMNEIDKYGFFIGNTIIAIEDIIHIELKDRYQKRLQFIRDNSSTLNINSRVTIWKEGNALMNDFNHLMKKDQIVTFFLSEDDFVIGKIDKFDENYIIIKNIGREGDEDGISCYPINSIVGLRYDGVEEQKIKLLYENRTSFYL